MAVFVQEGQVSLSINFFHFWESNPLPISPFRKPEKNFLDFKFKYATIGQLLQTLNSSHSKSSFFRSFYLGCKIVINNNVL